MDFENSMNHQTSSGTETEFSIDPSTVRGMKDFQPGDTVSLKVDATVGDTGEDGKVMLTITRIEAEPMNQAKKIGRHMMGRKPDMAGTAMESGAGADSIY